MFRNSIILFLICFCVHLQTNAQPSDFLSLHNKKGLTVKTFLPGSSIVFGDVSGQTISGIVKKMMHDSLFVEQYDLRRAYDRWGFSVIDTVTRYTLKFHYKDIKWILKPSRSFGFIRNGTIFMIGGTAYTFLHLFNSINKKEPINGITIVTSTSIAAFGWILHKLYKPHYIVGKKYSLTYLKMIE